MLQRVFRFTAALALVGALSLPLGAAELPRASLGYIFTTHQEPIMVAMAKGEAFEPLGAYLKPVVDKERYNLFVDGVPVARINIVVTKSGSEMATLFAQNHLHMGLGSLPAMMSSVDAGTPIKVLCPVHTEGMGLVVAPDSPVVDWDSLLAAIRGGSKPYRIGYHSPTSAPKIVLEGALLEAGLKLTHDGADLSANVLLVDLKSTGNLAPALTSGQVDAWVGPDPFPAVAEVRKTGRTVFDLKELPPAGRWSSFPCCVAAARTDFLAERPEVAKGVVKLLAAASEWINENQAEAGRIAAQWIGIPEEATEHATIVYGADPNEAWLKGAGVYLDVLNGMDSFKGSLKGKTLEEAIPLVFDFSFNK